MRNPEGVWGWLGQERRELKIPGMFLTNREVFDYFRDADIAKTHKPHTGVAGNCLAMEFIKQLGAGGAEEFQDDFGKFVRTIGEYLNTDALGKQFGKSDVYDNTE